MLKSHPKAVHLTHVLQDEFNRVIDIATFSLILIAFIWQDILHHLEQVVAKEEPAGRLLHALDHIEQVGQDEFDGSLLGLDVGRANSDKKVKARDHTTRMLDGFVQVGHLAALPLLLNEV